MSWLENFLPGKSNINFKDFVKAFISWIFIIIITFLFVKIAFEKLIGVQVMNNNTNKVEPPPPPPQDLPRPAKT